MESIYTVLVVLVQDGMNNRTLGICTCMRASLHVQGESIHIQRASVHEQGESIHVQGAYVCTC